MSYQFTDIDDLKDKIKSHLKAFFIFDLPEGRHLNIIEEFYAVQKKPEKDSLNDKLLFINANLLEFNQFLKGQGKYVTYRVDAERQAKLEPERTKTAIQTLTEMGFRVTVIDKTEINFIFNGSLIKYYPYSRWASGKTIKDGRGFENLIEQLKPKAENQDLKSMEPLVCHINKITEEETLVELSPLELFEATEAPIVINLIASFNDNQITEIKKYFALDDVLIEEADMKNPFYFGYITFKDENLTAYEYEAERLDDRSIALIVAEIRKFYQVEA